MKEAENSLFPLLFLLWLGVIRASRLDSAAAGRLDWVTAVVFGLDSGAGTASISPTWYESSEIHNVKVRYCASDQLVSSRGITN